MHLGFSSTTLKFNVTMLANLHPILLLLATTYAYNKEDLYEPPPLAPRESWLARPSLRPVPDNILPAQKVIIMHTGGENCETPGECVKAVRSIQEYYMDSLGMADIPFNFLVGGDGILYVGRGWYKEGEHTPGFNQGSIGVVYIGNFANVWPNVYQVDGFVRLLHMGLGLNLLSPDYYIVGQCQLVSSDSPGKEFMKIVTQSSRFNSSISADQCT